MSDLFLRSIEVVAGPRKFINDEFDTYFDIPFDDGPDVNIGEVEIFNLSSATIAAMKKGQKLILNAGYQKDVGAALIGEIKRIETRIKGVDKITTLFVIDANDNWMRKEIKKTYKEGIKAEQVLRDLIPHTGLKIGALKLPVNKVYTGAKTVEGKVGKIIVDMAKDCNAKIHINRGRIFIREKNEGDQTGFLLNKDRGLIGSPTPIEKEEQYTVVERVKKTETVKGKKTTKYVNEYVKKTRIRKGFKVIALFNHNFTTDVILKIASKTANGLFRIEKGKHIATGSSYYTEMEVYPR